MEISLAKLERMSIKQLKHILHKLTTEPQTAKIQASIAMVKQLIKRRKEGGYIVHPNDGKTRRLPMHLAYNHLEFANRI